MEHDLSDPLMIVAAGLVLRRGAHGAIVASGRIESAVEMRIIYEFAVSTCS